MNKVMEKKLAVMTAVVLIVVLLTGCRNKEAVRDHTLRVGVVTYTQNDAFIGELTDSMKSQFKSMETEETKIIMSVRSGDDEQRDQDEVVEEMIDAGCDVLCVNLVDRTAPSNIIKMAKQNDIPVIFFNREPVREDLMQWNKLYYVGCDAKQSGVMQGELAVDYIESHGETDRNHDGKIQYVLMEGEAGHQDAISRTDCSVKTIMESGINLEKLSYQFADWNRGQAENRMSQLINQYGDSIEMVLSNNDEMALGVIEAYEKAGYDEDEYPIIFGIDGLDDALDAIKSGAMKGTVYNDKDDQAREMVRLAVDIFKGNSLSDYGLRDGRYYMSEYQKVDAESVDNFIK